MPLRIKLYTYIRNIGRKCCKHRLQIAFRKEATSIRLDIEVGTGAGLDIATCLAQTNVSYGQLEV